MPTRELSATDRVRDEWAARVHAEYQSCALTQHLTLWLIQMGASPDLVRDGLRIAEDELTHAELSHATLAAAGGALTAPIPRDQLGLRRTPGAPLEADVLRVGVRAFCLGETVAVPLFTALRRDCTAPTAREALDRVLRDEVRHRDFGWTLLDWLLDTAPDPDAVVAAVQASLPDMFAELRGLYAGPGADATPISAAERAWGLMDAAAYADVLATTYERQYVPWFAERGVDARAAWGG